MTKKCCRCKQEKELGCFGGNGARLDCKDCRKEVYYQNRDKMLEQKRRSYIKHKKSRLKKMKNLYANNPGYYKEKASNYYYDNKEKVSEQRKDYRLRNAEIIKQNKREYYQHPEVKEISRQKSKEWKKNNPEKRREMEKRYFDKSPYRKVIRNLRSRIYKILRDAKLNKHSSTIEQIGCNPQFLKQYLESKFYSYIDSNNQTIEMTWEKLGNGPGTFQIDHIIPLFSFDFSIPDQQGAANHYSNLQPLWFDDHNKKSQSDLQYKQNFENIGLLPKFTNLTSF